MAASDNSILDFSHYITGLASLVEASANIRGLKKDVTAFSKVVDQDAERIKAGLEKVATGIKQIRDKGADLNIGGSEADRKTLRELSKEVQQLAAEQAKLNQRGADVATTQRTLRESTSVFTKELLLQRTALKQAFEVGDLEGIKRAGRAIRALNVDTENLSKLVRGSKSEFTAAAGSYDAADQALQKLRTELQALEGGFSGTNPRAAELKEQIGKLDAQLRASNKSMDDAYSSISAYTRSVLDAVGALEREKDALTTGAKALRAQADATGLSRDQQRLLQQEIEQTDEKLNRVNQSLAGYGVGLRSSSNITTDAANSLKDYVLTVALATFSFEALAEAGQAVFRNNMEFADKLSDIQKTTGLTADESDRLAESLKSIPTRTSLGDLLDISAVAGTLGRTKDEVLGFTKSVDVANTALGDSFGNNAELIATKLGMIGNVYRRELGPDIAQNILGIGSALNQLGDDGAATPDFLAEVAGRIGQLSSQYKLGLDNALAYAAVLNEQSTTAEVAGSSLNKLFSTIAGKPEAAFKIAKLGDTNLTLKQFTRLINQDFNAAIQAFLKGVRSGNTEATNISARLSSLKLDSEEAKNAILALAENTDTFAARQATANTQLREATSLAAEAEKKNNNLAGSWETLKNSIINTTTNGEITAFLKASIDFFNGGVFNNKQAEKSIADIARAYGATGGLAAQTASKSALLYQEYLNLNGVTARTTEQNTRLRDISLQLRDLLGESVVTLNKQTQAYEINGKAVEAGINKQRTLRDEQVKNLAKQLSTTNQVIAQEKLLNEAQIKDSDNRLDLASRLGITEESLEKIRFYVQLRDKGLGYNEGLSLPKGVTQDQVAAFEALDKASEKQATTNIKLEVAEKARLVILSRLRVLGQSEADALAKLSDEREKDAGKGGDALVKAKQAVADLAAEEFKLQKQRLDARIADLDRQADNPANSEQIRNSALQKGSQERIALSALEIQEEGRLTAIANKDKINGEAATAKAKFRLSEKYDNDVRLLNQKLSKDELALHNFVLDQLANVDKLAIESELEGLEAIASNENKSYLERQKAALNASARRIELILIESDIKRRAAKGDAQVLAQIQIDQDKQTANVLTKSKPFDSAKYLDEVRKRYAEEGLILEEARAKGLITERQYAKEDRERENDEEREAIAAIEREFGRTEEVVKRKRALRKRENDQARDDEKEHQKLVIDIIQRSLSAAQELGDLYAQYKSKQNEAELDNLRRNYESAYEAIGEQDSRRYEEARGRLDYQKGYELEKVGTNEADKAAIEEKYREQYGELEAMKSDAQAKLQEQYAERERELRVRQAKADRAAALFNIGINTAQGVLSVLSTGGGTAYADFGISAGLLSAFVIASGAAQAAAVLAAPLAMYFKGRESGPAEWAMVGERGPELIQGKSGGMKLVEKPSIIYLEQNDKVLTAQRTQEFLRASEQGLTRPFAFQESMMAVSAQLSHRQPAPVNHQLTNLSHKFDEVVRAIERVPGFQILVNDNEIRKTMTGKNGLTTLANQRLAMKGRTRGFF